VFSHIHELFIYLSYSLDNSLQIGNNPSSSVSTSQPSCNYYCYVYYRQEKCGQQQQQQQQHRMSPHNNNINNNNIDDNSLTYDNYPNSNNTIIMHSPSPIGISSSSSSSSSVVSSTGSMSEIKYGDGNEDNLLRQSIIIVSKWIFPQLAFRLLHKIDETLAWNTDHTTCIVRAPGK